nr:hypothetical protein [uncultured Tolumonas sp.]
MPNNMDLNKCITEWNCKESNFTEMPYLYDTQKVDYSVSVSGAGNEKERIAVIDMLNHLLEQSHITKDCVILKEEKSLERGGKCFSMFKNKIVLSEVVHFVDEDDEAGKGFNIVMEPIAFNGKHYAFMYPCRMITMLNWTTATFERDGEIITRRELIERPHGWSLLDKTFISDDELIDHLISESASELTLY